MRYIFDEDFGGHLLKITRQSKHCGFSIYIFDNSKSKSMVRLVRAEKIVLSGLVFVRKIARMVLRCHACDTQGCIFRLTCSYPELTEDHVLTSAYVKFFRTVTRSAVNKSV